MPPKEPGARSQKLALVYLLQLSWLQSSLTDLLHTGGHLIWPVKGVGS